MNEISNFCEGQEWANGSNCFLPDYSTQQPQMPVYPAGPWGVFNANHPPYSINNSNHFNRNSFLRISLFSLSLSLSLPLSSSSFPVLSKGSPLCCLCSGDASEPLWHKTLTMDSTHYGGLLEYNVHNLYGFAEMKVTCSVRRLHQDDVISTHLLCRRCKACETSVAL